MPSIDADGQQILRIVSWNCRQGLAPEKSARLLGLAPDVVVIQECAQTAELAGMIRVAWAGAIPTMGMAIFVRSELNAVPLEASADVLHWCLPVRCAAMDLDIVGVWGFDKNGKAGPPRGVARTAIHGLSDVLAHGPAVVIGDFNDGPHFDASHGRSFARTSELLGSARYRRLYHARTGEAYGAETAATFFFTQNLAKPFFIDHAFLPARWLEDVRGFEIGSPEKWLNVSDHMPLVLDLAVPPATGAPSSTAGTSS